MSDRFQASRAHHVIPRGVLCVSAACTEEDIELTRKAVDRAAARVASAGRGPQAPTA